MEVTPEQAGVWLSTRPPAPIMWTPDIPADEKAHRFAGLMADGKWNNDLPVEPILISADNDYVLGGHHRLNAIRITGKPQEVRVRFFTKPKGWDAEFQKILEGERVKSTVPACRVCGWQGDDIEAHATIHREE